MSRLSTIELFKEDMKFSVGHFTVFSDTIRENLHGHNYNVHVFLTTEITHTGLSFDYRHYKKKLQQLCKSIDETVLIAQNCPFFKINSENDYIYVLFANEEMRFLKRDITLLPVTNITVEELSNWFMQCLLDETEELKQNKIMEITIKVFSGPGQSGATTWSSLGEAEGVTRVNFSIKTDPATPSASNN